MTQPYSTRILGVFALDHRRCWGWGLGAGPSQYPRPWNYFRSRPIPSSKLCTQYMWSAYVHRPAKFLHCGSDGLERTSSWHSLTTQQSPAVPIKAEDLLCEDWPRGLRNYALQLARIQSLLLQIEWKPRLFSNFKIYTVLLKQKNYIH